MQSGSQKACRAHAHSWVRRRRINISRRERKRSNRSGASVVPTDRPQWRSNGVGRFTSGVTVGWAVWARGQGAPSAAAPELRTFFKIGSRWSWCTDLQNCADIVLSPAQNLQVITVHNCVCCMGVFCTWVKLLTDLQILGGELHK